MKFDTMAFSHRPQDGISLGICVIDNKAYMSASFVRNGDCFNRKLAHRILAQRVLSHVADDKEVRFLSVITLDKQVDARSIVRELRKVFKPDPSCSDKIFTIERDVISIGASSFTLRGSMTRDEQWAKMVSMFSAATQAAMNTVPAV